MTMHLYLDVDNPEIPPGWGIERRAEKKFLIFKINPSADKVENVSEMFEYVPCVVCSSYLEALKACQQCATPQR